ncbi:hypothetical protein DSO57_1010359 [Entomophthora muscae]|uniref:Uncharacterized protein n=1 Tax=Entomophthora muscae TaxID=34485 RepID=A0ACC2UFG1_9FUNG|nr:hypothetical protein DSO57_1010359 [Entomophthora muscae]
MSKLLHNTVFFRITETGFYKLKGELYFNQCSVKVICTELPAALLLTTPPPPALAALFKEYKEIFSETLDQLPPPQKIQHILQLQGLLPKARPLYCLTPKEDNTLHQHICYVLRCGTDTQQEILTLGFDS